MIHEKFPNLLEVLWQRCGTVLLHLRGCALMCRKILTSEQSRSVCRGGLYGLEIRLYKPYKKEMTETVIVSLLCTFAALFSEVACQNVPSTLI